MVSRSPVSSFRRTHDRFAPKIRVGQEARTEQEYPRIPFRRGEFQGTGANVLRAEHPSAVGLLHSRKGVVPSLLDHSIYLGGDCLILLSWQVMPMRFVRVEA